MDVQAISTALAATLKPLGIRVYDYGPAAPISPAAWIAPETVTYHETFDGTPDATFILRFFVSTSSDQGGQAQLNGFISDGPGSPIALLEADNKLGGVVASLEVVGTRPNSYGVVAIGDSRFYSAELTIDIYM